MPQNEVVELLRAAADRDTSGILARYVTRFNEEMGVARPHGVSWLDRSLGSEYRVGTNRVLAGIGYDMDWTGARATDDVSEANAGGRIAAASRYVAALLSGGRDGIEELQLVLASRAIGLWAGRKDIGFAPGSGGGLVLDEHRFDGLGVFLARPLRLPVAGATRFEMHFSRIDNVLNLNGSQNDVEPWFWTARASFQPHARFRLAATRAMMFGGNGNLPVTVARVLKNIAGVYTSGGENSFANQVAAIDLRYRAPTGAVPTTLYLDFAADDAYGAVWHVPGFTAGVELSGLPRHDLLFGLERTEFGRNRTTRSLWYQNAWFRGSWADDGVVLGHPLGGNGVEWRVAVSGGSPSKGITGALGAYRRYRGSQNVFAPERQGPSAGASAHADARLGPVTHASLQGEIEHGTGTAGWTTATMRAALHVRF